MKVKEALRRAVEWPLLREDQFRAMGVLAPPPRCRANVARVRQLRSYVAHLRQSRPDSGLGVQVIVIKPF